MSKEYSLNELLNDENDGCFSFPNAPKPAMVWKIGNQKLAIFIDYEDNSINIEFQGQHEWMITAFPYVLSNILIHALEEAIRFDGDSPERKKL